MRAVTTDTTGRYVSAKGGNKGKRKGKKARWSRYSSPYWAAADVACCTLQRGLHAMYGHVRSSISASQPLSLVEAATLARRLLQYILPAER